MLREKSALRHVVSFSKFRVKYNFASMNKRDCATTISMVLGQNSSRQSVAVAANFLATRHSSLSGLVKEAAGERKREAGDFAASAVVNVVRPESYRAMRRFAIRLRVVFRPELWFVRTSWLNKQTILNKL
jgi:hypothetical protein